MKILIENETNLIKYAEYNILSFANMSLALDSENTVIFTIGDMNTENSTLETIAKDILPADFIGDKYKWVNSEFILNEDYTYWKDGKQYNYLDEEIVDNPVEEATI